MTDTNLQLEVAQLIVESLNLDIVAADIAPDAPLYGDGLGLDSIDILELSLAISKRHAHPTKQASFAINPCFVCSSVARNVNWQTACVNF